MRVFKVDPEVAANLRKLRIEYKEANRALSEAEDNLAFRPSYRGNYSDDYEYFVEES